MKRVFYIECSGPVWWQVAENCREDANWQPVLWTAAAGDKVTVSDKFPEVLFVAGPDATLGLQEAPWPILPPSASMLQALASSESIALHMMDRMDPACGSGFPHDARRRHWYRLIAWWNAALDNLKPDLIIFSIAPHVVFDYALLALARNKNIPTAMFERLGLPGWVFLTEDYDKGSHLLRSALARAPTSFQTMPDAFRQWLESSISGGEAVPANFQKKLARYRLGQGNELPSITRALGHEFKRAIVLVRRNGFSAAPNSYLRSARAPFGRAGPFETFASRLRGVFRKRALMRLHDSMSQMPPKDEDYVFLALHYQPERATVPMGGVFGDQLLIIDTIVASLPEGWKLYVKEHPWQLQPFGRGEVQRSEEFYLALKRHPQVVLVARDVPTPGLVRGARAVATVTGSVGWDALCAGIPVLLFGAAWYRDCPGAFPVSELRPLKVHMERIKEGSGPTAADVTRFCRALSSVCVPGVLEPDLENAAHLSLHDAASTMAKALMGLVPGTANDRT